MRFIYCFLFYYLSILVHELGHLFAARIVGWKPLYLTLGYDRPRTIFRIGDVRFKFGVCPFGGNAWAVSTTPSHFRLKQLSFVAGGPLATLSLFLLLLALVFNSAWMSRLPGLWQEMAIYFLVVETILLGGSVIPHDIRKEGKRTPNDARLILKTLAMKKSDVKAYFASHVRILLDFFLQENRIAEAKAILLGSIECLGNDLDVRMYWIHSLLQAGKKSEAQAEIDTLLEKGVRSKTRAGVLDAIACLPITYGHRDLIEDSMRYIDEALMEEPETITLKGTKGSLLVEQGLLDDGIRLLEEVLITSDSVIDKAFSEYFLALAFHKRGDRQQSLNCLKSAIAIEPRCVVRPRISSEILGAEWKKVTDDGVLVT